jgi:hypothetical protein
VLTLAGGADGDVMLNVRMKAARTVAADLQGFEKALDEALTLGSLLQATMIKSRLEAKLAAEVGQEALESVAKTLTLMVDARRQIVAAHGGLKQVAGDIGVPTVGYGDALKPPQPTGSLADSNLKLVG